MKRTQRYSDTFSSRPSRQVRDDDPPDDIWRGPRPNAFNGGFLIGFFVGLAAALLIIALLVV